MMTSLVKRQLTARNRPQFTGKNLEATEKTGVVQSGMLADCVAVEITQPLRFGT
jgi:hypothetical protein